jgi:hypothetical protein
MNGEAKITNLHRDRLAVIYLRQSSMAQVREHTESTTRQYGLAEEAVQLGWARLDVLVIDTDLGVSGRWGVARAGVRRAGGPGVFRRGGGDLRDRDLPDDPSCFAHGHAPDDVTGHRARARWYTTKAEPSYDDMAVNLCRVIIAARLRNPCPEQATVQETRAVVAAWAAAET